MNFLMAASGRRSAPDAPARPLRLELQRDLLGSLRHVPGHGDLLIDTGTLGIQSDRVRDSTTARRISEILHAFCGWGAACRA